MIGRETLLHACEGLLLQLLTGTSVREDYSLMEQRVTPTKLYALQLKLRPLEHGTLMPFSGELVHGAWLNWIRAANPDLAALLHEGNKRRLFTCSSLQFPLSPTKILPAQQENKHLPLDPEKLYTIRITLLLGELYPLFYHTLLHRNTNDRQQ